MRVTAESEHESRTDRHHHDSTETAWSGKPLREGSRPRMIDAARLVTIWRPCPACGRHCPEEPTVERRQHTGKLGVHPDLDTSRGRGGEDDRAEHC